VCLSVCRELPRKQKEILSYLRKYRLVIAPNSFGMQVLVSIIVSNLCWKIFASRAHSKTADPWKRSLQFYTVCSLVQMLSVSSKGVKENKLTSDFNEQNSNQFCRKNNICRLLLLSSILCLFYQIVFSGNFLFLTCIFRTVVISRCLSRVVMCKGLPLEGSSVKIINGNGAF
jgi:fatty-acid desaturase